MENKYKISVVIPVYNSSAFINKCMNSLYKQDFKKPFEIIIIDDASTDNTLEMIKKWNLLNISFFSLALNSGPSAARNIGIKHAKGEYIYFLDADDAIQINTFSKLYKAAKEKNYDMVFADVKNLETKKDQRNNIFFFNKSKTFYKKNILHELKKRFYDPLYYGGLIGCTGRLIKRYILIKNKVFFNEKLRITEDETFSWAILAYVKKAKYIKEKLYSYYINPNVKTAVAVGFRYRLSISKYKLISTVVKKTFKKFNLKKKEINKLSDQALVYMIISSLISFSRSIILGKFNSRDGAQIRKKFIKKIVNDKSLIKSIKNYTLSANENSLIPRAMIKKNIKILELACVNRAKEILQIRRGI